tara:strand:- start:602 stop:964 length:363 start_codon:yes stop_codon:yes gene_type:complete
MYKLLSILLIFSFVFTQEPCEGTCLSEEESKNITNNIKELQFDLDNQLKINENLNSQIYMYIQSDSLNNVLLKGYKTQLKLKNEMIKVIKPKWYENKWLWFGLGIICTAGSVKLASELVD